MSHYYNQQETPPSESGAPPPTGYAPPEPSQYGGSVQPDNYNAIAPYNEEKAYAEYSRGYEDRPPPARSEYGRRHDDRDRRYEDRRGYDGRDRPHHDRGYDDDRSRYDDRDRHERRDDRDDRDKPPGKLDRILGEGKDGERGLGATLIGGAGGAFLGHEMVGKGALGTIGGAIAGALGANAIEHHEDKKKHKRNEEQHHHHHRRREGDGERDDPRRDDYPRDDGYTASTAGAMYQQGRQYEQGRRLGRHEGRRQRSKRGDGSSSESWSSDD